MIIDGLRALLGKETDIQICATAHDGRQLLSLLPHTQADLIVLDLSMPPGMGGLATTRLLREHYPDQRVLILTMYNTREHISDLIGAGAHGYILKNAGREEFIAAIRRVARGGTYFSQEVVNTMLTPLRPPATPAAPTAEAASIAELTKREMHILRLIAAEYTTSEIGEALAISTHTVETHRRNLLRKLNVRNAAGLVRFAVEHHLL